MSRDRIIARVKSLRELREDRGCTANEAANARRLADNLIKQYQITPDELGDRQQPKYPKHDARPQNDFGIGLEEMMRRLIDDMIAVPDYFVVEGRVIKIRDIPLPMLHELRVTTSRRYLDCTDPETKRYLSARLTQLTREINKRKP